MYVRERERGREREGGRERERERERELKYLTGMDIQLAVNTSSSDWYGN